jgi:hypothetical protein
MHQCLNFLQWSELYTTTHGRDSCLKLHHLQIKEQSAPAMDLLLDFVSFVLYYSFTVYILWGTILNLFTCFPKYPPKGVSNGYKFTSVLEHENRGEQSHEKVHTYVALIFLERLGQPKIGNFSTKPWI